MRPGKAILFGILGAAAISLLTAVLRAAGLPLSIEIILGTLTGLAPSGAAFGLGLLIHLMVGGLFGLLYGFLWERRLPTTLESVAIVLVVASVLACVTAHRARSDGTEPVSQPEAGS